MDTPGRFLGFESSELFLLDGNRHGLRHLERSPEIADQKAMALVVDDIREHMYYHAGQVFANLESLAYAASTKSEDRGPARYYAAIIGGALAYASVWLSVGEGQDELPEEVAQKQGLWSPEQITSEEDMNWSTLALRLGRQEWARDPVLRSIVEKHAAPHVDEADLQLCYDSAGFIKYSLAVSNLYSKRQLEWIRSQIAAMETNR